MSILSKFVLRMRVDVTDYDKAWRQTLCWVKRRESRYVCVANVHMTMEAFDSPKFGQVVNRADLVTPDGRPLVWALRLMGAEAAAQVRGADLMSHLMSRAAQERVPVGLYGGKPEVLEKLAERFQSRFPELEFACIISPPFRPLTKEEDNEITEQLANSGARILFVGLGCPRQERWMSEHLERIPAVMLGVGAAFDFHAGMIKEAPRTIQRMGLEWAFRLLMDPRRLWKRYVRHNPRFIVLFILQLLGLRNSPKTKGGQAHAHRNKQD